jgi:outer membrane protein
LIILSLTFSAVLPAQETKLELPFSLADSLSLEAIVQQVITTHPSVLKASEGISMAEAGIGLAKSGHFPDIDFSAGYTFLGPIPTITIPDMGSFKMGTPSNFNSAINIRETVFDFSRSASQVKLQESTKDLAGAGIEVLKQKLALATTLDYYSLIFFQEALVIKEKQIETLREHLKIAEKKEQTGSSTRYEVLSTQVRLSAAESQKVDIETAWRNTLTVMNSLLGFASSTVLKVKKVPVTVINSESPEAMLDYAINHRPEMLQANFRQQHAQLNLQSVKLQNKPSLAAFTSGGFRNGYIPDLNKIRANFAMGLTLKVPVFSATRQKYNEQLATGEINMAEQDVNLVRRDISSEIYQNDAGLKAAERKIAQSELQVKQAEEARRLAESSYKAGTVTNLDLLDAETIEAESRLNLLKAQSDYAINLSRLNYAAGKQIF